MARDHRNDRKDRRNDAPEAPPAATQTDETIGGKSAMDEVETQIANQIIGKLLWMLASWKPIQVAIADLSPTAKLVFEGMPTAAAYAVAKLPKKWFRSPELADAFKDVIMDASKTINEIVQKGGVPSEEEIGKAIDKAVTDVMSATVVVDPLRQFHRKTCVNLSAFQQPQQPQKGRDGQPLPPRPSKLLEIPLSEAIKQKLQASPCCHDGIQAELVKGAAPKPAKRGRSVFDIIGSTKDEELRRQFVGWFSNLSGEDRTQAIQGLAELDSEEELVGFMALIAEKPELALESLPLLKERNAKHLFLPTIRAIGDALKGDAESVGHRLAEFDRRFAPKVAELKVRRAQRLAEKTAKEVKAKKPESWWKRRVQPWLEAFLPF